MKKYDFDYCIKCGCKLLYEEEYDKCTCCRRIEMMNEGKLVCTVTFNTFLLTMRNYDEEDLGREESKP